MNATINLEKHFPVLLNELVSIISPLYGGTFIDCTFGAGGYSKKILENNLNNIIALDRDNSVNRIANQFYTKYKKRFKFYNKKFSDIDQIKEDNILKEVAIKVLRPDIKKVFNDEIEALMLLAYIIES